MSGPGPARRNEHADPGPVKEAALQRFMAHLLASKSGPLMGEVRTFGSVARGDARPESDVDLLIFATRDPRTVQTCAIEASFQTSLETGEYVAPVVYCLDRLRYPRTPFLDSALGDSREVHRMGDKELHRAEARGYIELARIYRRGAGRALKAGDARIAVDAAYNAAELCAKGLLLLHSTGRLPRSHGGIVEAVGRLVVVEGYAPKELRRELAACLRIRRIAQYEPDGEVGPADARRVLRLATGMIRALDAALEASGEV